MHKHNKKPLSAYPLGLRHVVFAIFGLLVPIFALLPTEAANKIHLKMGDGLWHLFVFAIEALVVAILALAELLILSRERWFISVEKIDAVQNSLRNYIEPLGTSRNMPQRKYARLRETALEAKDVKNTLIFFSSKADLTTDAKQYIGGNNADRRQELIEEVVARGDNWTDIYSERDVSLLNTNIRKIKEGKNGVYYRPLVMKETFPVVNMTLFTFDDDTKEVWFGFGLFDNYFGPVFRSNAPSLCEYFEKYFKILEADSRPWLPSGRQYLEAAWVTACYDMEGGLINCAALYIHLDGRELVIDGLIFDFISSDFRLARSFESTSSKFDVSVTPPVLAFTFKDTFSSTDEKCQSGSGFYTFKSPNRLHEFTGEVNSFGGQGRLITGRKMGKSYANRAIIENVGRTRRLLIDIVRRGDIATKSPILGDSPFKTGDFFRGADDE